MLTVKTHVAVGPISNMHSDADTDRQTDRSSFKAV